MGCSTLPGGPYASCGNTANKSTTSHFVDGLDPNLTYYFTVTAETDAHPNNTNKVISKPSAEVNVVTIYQNAAAFFGAASDMLVDPDPFVDTPFTFLDDNAGFDAIQDANIVAVDANFTNLDKLTVTSSGASWEDAQDDGLFLGMSVWEDFSVELTINSLDAVAGHSVGLMVRVPTTDGLDAAGPGQDYVTLGVSADITQITWSSTDDSTTVGAVENKATALGLDTPNGTVENEIHVRIQRNGSVLRNGSELNLSYRIGSSTEWVEVDASPLEREDMDTLELEVGIFQTTTTQSTAIVDDFKLISEKIYQSGFE